MSIFKCKMCGGDLEIAEGVTIAECEYCGTKQTVPKAMEDNLKNLFNRANTLRIKSEFDKAEKLYEKIIQADSTQSEAYWGLILCKYGIEYVDDPTSFKKVPTCHRTSYDSIIADDDYKSAIENADMSQRIIYEEQAKEIDRIQKEILSLALKEEKYDVFICYKESDGKGQRTQDSVIANDIYYQLTGEGFKVFYAAITLEGKLGNAYEPIIFAALNSSRVMLVIGTKPEYFNAVWVKNEWSRFLKIIKKDRSKLLIPCYRDMDAYELPDEFAHLQAQDMSKIGFINDIVRGIKKLIKSDAPQKAAPRESVIEATAAPSASPLLKRAFLFLEDGDFESADEYAEKVLDIEPECAEAYFAKLLIEFELRTADELKALKNPISNSPNYKKILRFAKPEYRETVESYNATINKRIDDEQNEKVYLCAVDFVANYHFDKAIELFETIPDYKDSAEKIKLCGERKEKARKNAIYSKALERAYNLYADDNDIKNSIEQLHTISGYKDADEKIRELDARLEKWYADEAKAEEEARIRAEEERRTRERQRELGRIAAEKRRKRNKKIAIIASPIVCVFLVIIIIASAIHANSIEGIYDWEILYDGTVEINGINENKIDKLLVDGILTLPSEIDGNEVAEIGSSAFEGCTSLECIVIPDSVTSIGKHAFSGCTSLESITIPDSVTLIESSVFSGCISLERVTISDGVKNIYNNAFEDCTSLTSITIPDSVTSIGSSAFSGCTSLESIAIPSSVTSIGSSAFRGCTSLVSITIPNSVTSIGSYAFSGCARLGSIAIPSSVTSIGEYAFYDCTSLVSITIPSSVTSIGNSTFYGCTSLKSITIPSSVTSIGNSTFYGCTSLESITIPNGVTSIEASAFRGCTKLTINCEASSKPEGWDSYWNPSNRPVIWGDYIQLKYSLSSDSTYYIVTGIGTGVGSKIVIPSTYNGLPVKQIGAEAFEDCNNLTSVVILEGVTSIGEFAFYGCDSLESITIPVSVTSIGSSAFGYCSSLASISVDEDNANYKSIDGNLYTKDGKGLIQYAVGKTDTHFSIPSGVTRIESSAFYYCTSLESITIPSSVTSIGYSAFSACTNLTSITIPNSVTSIGYHSFSGCASIKNITIPNSVTSIGVSAFFGCISLESITIPSSVTIIGKMAFANCKNLTIYCEASSKPSGWYNSWNDSNCPVVWGYKG